MNTNLRYIQKMLKSYNRPLSIGLIIIALTTRFIPHPPNLTAVGATALFGGSQISRPFNYLLVCTVMFVSDIVFGFHKSMAFVYLSFLFYVWLGERFLSNNKSYIRIGSMALLGGAVFFLLTNFGVWLIGGLYPKTAQGLIVCYINALPFARNMVIGDLFYSLAIFSTFAIMAKNAALKRAEEKVLAFVINK